MQHVGPFVVIAVDRSGPGSNQTGAFEQSRTLNMNTVAQVMAELKKKGNAQTRKTYARHGAPESMFGVKVGDLKTIAKTIKGKQQLALDLYDTLIPDAMYLAGLVADGSLMTKRQLQSWATKANWYMVSDYTVPFVATESKHGRDLANKWIESKKEAVASTGWSTWSGIVTITSDDDLDLDEVNGLVQRVEDEIDSAQNRVRYTMNGFVICVGGYVKPLAKAAKAMAKRLGKVEVDMGDTSCKVPVALDYIMKMESTGHAGKKRKSIRC